MIHHTRYGVSWRKRCHHHPSSTRTQVGTSIRRLLQSVLVGTACTACTGPFAPDDPSIGGCWSARWLEQVYSFPPADRWVSRSHYLLLDVIQGVDRVTGTATQMFEHRSDTLSFAVVVTYTHPTAVVGTYPTVTLVFEDPDGRGPSPTNRGVTEFTGILVSNNVFVGTLGNLFLRFIREEQSKCAALRSR